MNKWKLRIGYSIRKCYAGTYLLQSPETEYLICISPNSRLFFFFSQNLDLYFKCGGVCVFVFSLPISNLELPHLGISTLFHKCCYFLCTDLESNRFGILLISSLEKQQYSVYEKYALARDDTLTSPNPQNRNRLDLLQLSKRNNCIYILEHVGDHVLCMWLGISVIPLFGEETEELSSTGVVTNKLQVEDNRRINTCC